MSVDDIDYEGLADLSPIEQKAAMETWFRLRYEDPAQRTPYMSSEGGYIWVFGGPYDAADVLHNHFGGYVDEAVIEKLVDELEGECIEWAPTDYDEGLDFSLLEAISSNAKAFSSLEEAGATILGLLTLPVPPLRQDAFWRMLYVSAITALETYLSDTFIPRVLSDEVVLQKYLDSAKVFGERKVALQHVLREAARVKAVAQSELLDTVWHNLGLVKPMYRSVLGVDIGPIDALSKAVAIRHDLVHRDGKDKEGKPVEILPDDIRRLLSQINLLAARVDHYLDHGVPIEGIGPTDAN